MRSRTSQSVRLALCCALVALAATPMAGKARAQTQPTSLAAHIHHYDRSQVKADPGSHGGGGTLSLTTMLRPGAINAPLIFFQRGVLGPKSSIGEHFHNRCEETFMILNGEAQFTVDGRTSLIKGPVAVPARMGHAHGMYNPTDQPIEWLNINVSSVTAYDAFNLNDSRIGAPLDPIPQFINARLDPASLKPVTAMRGGMGTVQYRRLFQPTVYSTAWSYIDHVVVPPGASIGPNPDGTVAELYYVMNGAGQISSNAETADIKTNDLIAVDVGQGFAFANHGSAPLEMFVVGIAKDLAAKERILQTPSQPRISDPTGK